MTTWRERIKHWPVVGYLSGLAWSIWKLPTVVDHFQASDHYFRQSQVERLKRESEHSTRLHELLDFRTVTESAFAQLETDVRKLQGQLDEKAERRSLQDAQQLIARLTFHKADRDSVAELQRLVADLQKRAIPAQNIAPVVTNDSPADERYRIYLNRLKSIARSPSGPVPILHIGAAPARWCEVLRHGDLPLRVLNSEWAHTLGQLPQVASSTVSAVTCFHVMEHLSFNELVLLLDETLRILQPGGVAVFETVHPFAPAASGDTPVHPVFPETLAGLAQLRGFHTSECSMFDNVVTWIGGKRLESPVPACPLSE